MPMTFSAAIAQAPLRPFQLLLVGLALLMLVTEGIDLQSLSLVTPLILEEWGIDRALFGPALAGALFGMAFGSALGGWLGDRVGRLQTLSLAAVMFGLTTIATAYVDGVAGMTTVRVLGGLGFGAAYPNAIALANDWVPARSRTYVIAILAVGVPVGQAASALLVPFLLPIDGWRGVFVIFGVGTIVLGVLIRLLASEAPGYLLARGKKEAAQHAAARVIDPAIELVPETREGHADGQAIDTSAGLFDPANRRPNWGLSISYAAGLTTVYGLANWTPELLTSSGFSLKQALDVMFVFSVCSMVGGVAAGWLARAFGSRLVTIGSGLLTLLSVAGLAWTFQSLGSLAEEQPRLIVTVFVSGVGVGVSVALATFYAMMAAGYSQSCRARGIGFCMTAGRVGSIIMVFIGGWLINIGVQAFFAVLAGISLAIAAAAFIVDRQIEPVYRMQEQVQ